MNRTQSKQEPMKSIKFHCSALMTKYISKTMDIMNQVLVIILKTIQNSFLSSYKNIVLSFSLIRIDFLSSYNNITLILSIIRTAFLPVYKKIVLAFSLRKTVFFCVFVLVYIKWLIVNIVQKTIGLQKLIFKQ